MATDLFATSEATENILEGDGFCNVLSKMSPHILQQIFSRMIVMLELVCDHNGASLNRFCPNGVFSKFLRP